MEFIFEGKNLLLEPQLFNFNPTALRKAKIANNFGLSKCNRVKSIPALRQQIPSKTYIFDNNTLKDIRNL